MSVIAELKQEVGEISRKLDIVLQHIAGTN
jgi:hypothetical protein